MKKANAMMFFQKLSKAFLTPLALIASASLVMGIASFFTSADLLSAVPFLGNSVIQYVFKVLLQMGSVITSNFAALYAVSLPFALADEDKEYAAFAGFVGYLAFLTGMGMLVQNFPSIREMFPGNGLTTVLGIETVNTGMLGGIFNPAGTAFNPLFLYGASGVGKTHLANAIGTKIKELYADKRVLYVSAHLFQVQYTDSVRNNTTNDFINFYQTIDVLIIDDIQEFAGVTKTQNTFFHIFNHLHQNGKQLILTSDRAPVLLQGMEERLLTRFKWGMVAELEKPTVELRKNILRNKIHRDGLQFPPEVIDYIAENVNESVRDLEGIVIAIMARSTIFNKEIDLDLAQHIVHGVVHNETKAVTIDDILKVVCKHFDLEASAIHTKSRKREVVQARQIAMYLAKNYTDFSTSKIGKFIGNKDHATVLHACKTVKGQLEVDKSFQAEVQEIESLLKKKA